MGFFMLISLDTDLENFGVLIHHRLFAKECIIGCGFFKCRSDIHFWHFGIGLSSFCLFYNFKFS